MAGEVITRSTSLAQCRLVSKMSSVRPDRELFDFPILPKSTAIVGSASRSGNYFEKSDDFVPENCHIARASFLYVSIGGQRCPQFWSEPNRP
jgi:hypothetical protein